MSENDITVVVFTKNRALQLYALLESMKKYTNFNLSNVVVLAAYKEQDHFESLKTLKRDFGEVKFLFETNFQNQTKMLMAEIQTNYMVFITDDDLFKKQVNVSDALTVMNQRESILTFSLRHGTHLNFCYPVQQPQKVPQSLKEISKDVIVWRYKGESWDWNYPLSVNGHIFRTNKIKEIVFGIGNNWKAPNSFEGELQNAMPHLINKGDTSEMASFVESSVFNIPFNKVQTENANIAGTSATPEFLLQKWNEGSKIDISKYEGLKNISAHQEVPLHLTERNKKQ